MHRDPRSQKLRGTRDSGMTLIEMMVSLVIFSIAMGLVFSAVILVMKQANAAQQSADAVTEVRQALAQMDRQVRSGNVLFSPVNEVRPGSACEASTVPNEQAGTCMRIYTQSNGPQRCVQWQMVEDSVAADGSLVLRSRSWAADWQSSGDYTPWTVVARGLELEPGQYPFELMGASTPYDERLLQVSFLATDARQGEPIEISSSLSGRNTTYGYDANQCTPIPTE